VVHVGGLKLEEVEEGRVVDDERGPRRGDARGIGGKAVVVRRMGPIYIVYGSNEAIPF